MTLETLIDGVTLIGNVSYENFSFERKIIASASNVLILK